MTLLFQVLFKSPDVRHSDVLHVNNGDVMAARYTTSYLVPVGNPLVALGRRVELSVWEGAYSLHVPLVCSDLPHLVSRMR